MKQFTWVLQRFLFPVWLLLVGVSALWWYQQGLQPSSIVTAAGIASLMLVGILERALPYRQDWNKSRGDVPTDLISFALIAGIFEPVWKSIGMASALWLAILIAPYGVQLFPTDIPLAAQVALVFLIAEFGKYWAHRWHHESRVLWDFHAMHHVSTRLYLLNNFRLHPVNHLITYLFSLLPLTLIGVPTEPLLVYSAVFIAVTFFQHANINLKHGALNYVFSTNVLHRWHHSSKLPEGNRNYGSVLMIWDIVFGTFHYPAQDTAPDDIGISNLKYPKQGYLSQVWWPIKERCCA